jgi:hypothetical protein
LVGADMAGDGMAGGCMAGAAGMAGDGMAGAMTTGTTGAIITMKKWRGGAAGAMTSRGGMMGAITIGKWARMTRHSIRATTRRGVPAAEDVGFDRRGDWSSWVYECVPKREPRRLTPRGRRKWKDDHNDERRFSSRTRAGCPIWTAFLPTV